MWQAPQLADGKRFIINSLVAPCELIFPVAARDLQQHYSRKTSADDSSLCCLRSHSMLLRHKTKQSLTSFLPSPPRPEYTLPGRQTQSMLPRPFKPFSVIFVVLPLTNTLWPQSRHLQTGPPSSVLCLAPSNSQLTRFPTRPRTPSRLLSARTYNYSAMI
jgi:hypothetical protein